MKLAKLLRKKGITKPSLPEEIEARIEERLGSLDAYKFGLLARAFVGSCSQHTVDNYFRFVAQQEVFDIYWSSMYDTIIKDVGEVSKVLQNCGKAGMDIGCGDGLQTYIYAKMFPGKEFLGIDRIVESIELANKTYKSNSLSFDAADMNQVGDKYPSRFDFIIATQVLNTNIFDEYINNGFSSSALVPIVNKYFENIACQMRAALKEQGTFILARHYPHEFERQNFNNRLIVPSFTKLGFVIDSEKHENSRLPFSMYVFRKK